jgi:hypothetical protein
MKSAVLELRMRPSVAINVVEPGFCFRRWRAIRISKAVVSSWSGTEGRGRPHENKIGFERQKDEGQWSSNMGRGYASSSRTRRCATLSDSASSIMLIIDRRHDQ